MTAIQDEAIVIRQLDFSETSQVLVVLARSHGVQHVIAKGARRSTKTRFMPGIDLLERGDLVYRPNARGESRLGTLTEWRQIDPHLALRSALPRWHAGLYAIQITGWMLQESDPHPALYDGLAALLAELCGSAQMLPAILDYQWALLVETGLWPEFNRCVLSGMQAPPGRSAFFSFQQGGLISRRFQAQAPDARLIDAATLEAIRHRRAEPATLHKAALLLDEIISSHVDRKPGLPTGLAI